MEKSAKLGKGIRILIQNEFEMLISFMISQNNNIPRIKKIIEALSVALGLLSCFGYGFMGNIKIIGMQFLDFFDFISNSVLMPIVAFLTCIFVGYVIKPKAVIEEGVLDGVDYAMTVHVMTASDIPTGCVLLSYDSPCAPSADLD